jgi:GNAT superfamily N-acetyltransferase
MRIRSANVEDAPAVSRVHIDSWRTTYRGIVPDQVLDGLDYVRNEQRWRGVLSQPIELRCFLVAESDDGQVVGFATGGPNRTEGTGYNGELYAIYILNSHQRKGIGRALVLGVARLLARNSYTTMLVWVLEKNPARYFYEALGAKFVGRKRIEIGNAQLEEISYGWDDIAELAALHR